MPLWELPSSPSDWHWLFRCNFTLVFYSFLRFLLKESPEREWRNETSSNREGPKEIHASAGRKTIKDDDVTPGTEVQWTRLTKCHLPMRLSTRVLARRINSPQPTTACHWRMSTGEATNQFTCQMCGPEARVRDGARQFATVSPEAELVISQLWHFRAKLEANTHTLHLSGYRRKMVKLCLKNVHRRFNEGNLLWWMHVRLVVTNQ